MCFDSGDLRYLKWGGREVLRRIYTAVRDRNWGTAPCEITDFKCQIQEASFHITYTGAHQQDEIHFVCHAEISGDTNGEIHFKMDGEARTTFERNRIGFCVLHPILECAGARCRALYLNGTQKELLFPSIIAAEQPVRFLHDLAGLAHEIEPGVWAETRYEGDVFETEDQRNWIDASFKTYCTPLRLPFPMTIQAGDRVRQSVTLRMVSEPFLDLSRARKTPSTSAIQRQPQLPVLRLGDAMVKLPAIGLGASGDRVPWSVKTTAMLEKLGLAHLRHDAHLGSPDWPEAMEVACGEAKALNLPLELAVHLPDRCSGLLTLLAEWLKSRETLIARLLIFCDDHKSTTLAALESARRAFAAFKVPVGAGTNADLYQLNLERPPAGADLIVWSMNPQVHAFDDASIAETPEAAAHQIASVRQYFPGKPIFVSPVTLKPRFNPVASGPDRRRIDELPPQVDARQSSLFGAGWTLAMLKVLAEGGVDGMTFFETTGWRGVLEAETGSPLPVKFPSVPGGVFPLYHVFADVAEFAGGEIVETNSSEPLEVQCLVLQLHGRRRLMVSNLTKERTQVTIEFPIGESRIRRLNERSLQKAMREPEAFRNGWENGGAESSGATIALEPHELVTIDFVC